jgi:hypothetical protein
MNTTIYNARKQILEAHDIQTACELCKRYYRDFAGNGLGGSVATYRAILKNRIQAKMLAAYFYGGVHGALGAIHLSGVNVENFNVINVALVQEETAVIPWRAVMGLLGSKVFDIDRRESEFICEIMVRDLEIDRAVRDHYDDGSTWMTAFLEGKQELPMNPTFCTDLIDLFGKP